MKRRLLFMLFPMLSMAQTQIGADIDGEAWGDLSGTSVSLSSDGTTLAIGAVLNDGGRDNDIGQFNGGSVRVFKNVSGTWTQIGADIDGKIRGYEFGSTVSLSSDGATLAIGASTYSYPDGLVSVYKNVLGTWTQVGENIKGKTPNDYFGNSISLSSDGKTIAVGAWNGDGNVKSSGLVRVYKNVTDTWTQIGSDINGEANRDQSGYSVSLSSDGTTLAIGAPRKKDNNGLSSGSVSVYKNISGIWTQIGADIDGEAEGDRNGHSISLSSDGSILAIGAILNEGSGVEAGSVRVYKNVSGTWVQVGADIDGETAVIFSGASVSLSSDGTTLAIGSPSLFTRASGPGSVRLYKNVKGVWIQIGSDIDGQLKGDEFGKSVSLANDGKTLAIGAPRDDGNGYGSGTVRVYDLSGILSSDNFVLTNFSLYPNPASEFVTINLKEGLLLEKVTIYNAAGQIVKTEKNNVININSLQKGSYFFEVITNKGKATRTILVQ